jgi:trans-aconitate 2-methyltransferase
VAKEAVMWDARQYLRYGDERARPFLDLLGQVGAERPRRVVDLGCGPGNLTALLTRRWPAAKVAGVDNSPEMIEAARAMALPGVSFELGDVRDWRPADAPDVIICNAVLQWVPDHLGLVAGWAGLLAPGGWLAFQLPGNFNSPNHTLIAELASAPRWRPLLADVRLNRQAEEPAEYAGLLARPGFRVDAWETTYLHILPGENPVLEWAKGTALRPVLAALDAGQAAEFLAEYADRLRGAYRSGPFGTFFPFRRVFTVVHRDEAERQSSNSD